MRPLSPTRLRDAKRHARAAAEQIRLAFDGPTWRGRSGVLAGTAAGSSIEYHDHRPFLLGDDPRDLDWRAYARTGQYTRKTYREEVSPRIDLALDLSASMYADEGKALRTLELFHFCVEAGLRVRAALCCYGVSGSQVEMLSLDRVQVGEFAATVAENDRGRAPDLAQVPWRAHTLRVWISDLLFAGEAGGVLAGFAPRSGRAIVLAPHARAESEPDWSGSMEFIDVEGGGRQLRQIDERALARYRAAYSRHFELWSVACRRRSIALARVSSEGEFVDALCAEALPGGAVELWT